MIIGVLEIAGVASPKRILGRLDYLGTRAFRLLHDRVDFIFAAYIVSDGKLGGAVSGFRNVRIVGDVMARPNRKLQSGLQVKKGNSPMFKFLTNNPLSWQSQSVAIKRQRSFQIVYASVITVTRGFIRAEVPFTHLAHAIFARFLTFYQRKEIGFQRRLGNSSRYESKSADCPMRRKSKIVGPSEKPS